MDKASKDDTYSDAEAAARMDVTLRRMLATPPKPHKPLDEKSRRDSTPGGSPANAS